MLSWVERARRSYLSFAFGGVQHDAESRNNRRDASVSVPNAASNLFPSKELFASRIEVATGPTRLGALAQVPRLRPDLILSQLIYCFCTGGDSLADADKHH